MKTANKEDLYNMVKKLVYREDSKLLFNIDNNNVSQLKNLTSFEFYNSINESSSFSMAAYTLSQKYAVDYKTIEQDLLKFLVDLLTPMKTNNRLLKGHNILDFPLSIELEITSKCNWKCSFCYNTWKEQSSFKHVEMSYSQITQILDECCENKCQVIRYSGGEPFLHPDFFDILEYANLLKLTNIIFTNGSFLSETVIKKLEETNVKQILLSYHGDKYTHDKLTGIIGSYELTQRAITLVQNSSIDLTVEITLTKFNYDKLSVMLDYLIQNKVKNIAVMRYVNTGRNDKDNAVLQSEMKNIVTLSEEFIKKYPDVNIVFPCSQRLCLEDYPTPIHDASHKFSNTLLGSCEAGFNWCSVSVQGAIRICPHSSISFGNILDGLKSVWTNMRDTILNQVKQSVRCSNCSFFHDCYGGCYLYKIQ